MNIRRNFKSCMFGYKQYSTMMSAVHQELRGQSDKKSYPSNLIRNMILHTYPIQIGWSQFRERFEQGDSYTDEEKAAAESARLVDRFKESVISEIGALVQACPLTGSISFDNFKMLEARAASGDNKAVEELEFCCVCHNAILPMTKCWLALGLTGYTPMQAFLKTVEYVPCDERGQMPPAWMNNFVDFSRCINAAAFASIGGTGQYQGVYQSLPSLW